MENKLTREDCIVLLKEKSSELNGMLKKSDFSVEQVAMIKSYFGPWPRALEAAGIKEVTAKRIETLEIRKQKYIRSKIRKREYKINNKK